MLKAIPTNIITGFLGVGKTTAIRHLLRAKPESERWAVLVNEFGEVGIDGALFGGISGEEQGIFIREVPGGCMCCANGLPVQMALNMLLSRAKPQRLLIEPTGLGHPRELLEQLTADHYREVLDMRAVITLVDARKLTDSRYTDSDLFNQQLAVADLVVANKDDLCDPADHQRLLSFLAERHGGKPVHRVVQGAIELDWLQPATAHPAGEGTEVRSAAPSSLLAPQPVYSPEGVARIDNRGEGYVSRGWLFRCDLLFDHQALSRLLLEVDVERIKGVFITDQGVMGYNKADGLLTEVPLGEAWDSRIECIADSDTVFTGLEERLWQCVAAVADDPD